MEKVVNNINIKGNDYEIGLIINSFYSQHSGWEIKIFKTETYLNDTNIRVPSKLCIEAYKQIGFDLYEVEGLAFCFNSKFPYYVSYKSVFNKLVNCMYFFNDNQILRTNLISSDIPEYVKQYYKRVEFSTKNILEYIHSLKEQQIDNPKMYVGELISRNSSNSIIIDSMNIRIPNNDIVKGLVDILRSKKVNLDSSYSFICSSVMHKRDKLKDLNWFMYKMLLISKII